MGTGVVVLQKNVISLLFFAESIVFGTEPFFSMFRIDVKAPILMPGGNGVNEMLFVAFVS